MPATAARPTPCRSRPSKQGPDTGPVSPNPSRTPEAQPLRAFSVAGADPDRDRPGLGQTRGAPKPLPSCSPPTRRPRLVGHDSHLICGRSASAADMMPYVFKELSLGIAESAILALHATHESLGPCHSPRETYRSQRATARGWPGAGDDRPSGGPGCSCRSDQGRTRRVSTRGDHRGSIEVLFRAEAEGIKEKRPTVSRGLALLDIGTAFWAVPNSPPI